MLINQIQLKHHCMNQNLVVLLRHYCSLHICVTRHLHVPLSIYFAKNRKQTTATLKNSDVLERFLFFSYIKWQKAGCSDSIAHRF